MDGSLQQGDLLDQVPLVELQPPYDLNALQLGQRPKIKVRPAPVIVLTQSCDLEAGKVDNVLVCPHFLPEELSGIEELRSPKGRKRINQGMVVSVYLLPPCNIPGFEQGQRVVNFRQLATVPLGLAVAMADVQRSRIRLATPYREHLAQALARFMERVGLPVNYPDM